MYHRNASTPPILVQHIRTAVSRGGLFTNPDPSLARHVRVVSVVIARGDLWPDERLNFDNASDDHFQSILLLLYGKAFLTHLAW